MAQSRPMGRRKRRTAIALGAAGLVVLLGRGLGWLDGAEADLPPSPGASAGPLAADRGRAAGASQPDSPSAEGVDEDRLQAALSLARAAPADGRLGAALSVLDGLEGLSSTQARAVEAARGELRGALAAAVEVLERAVAEGEILEAARLLRALLDPPHRAVEEALQGLAARRGWPDLSARAPPGRFVVPAMPLPEGRLVRIGTGAGRYSARVADATLAEVTVRRIGPDGVTYPSYAVSDVEPVDASGDEAVESGLAALAAGRSALARLWLCRALLRGVGDASRLSDLSDALGVD
ncbi:MAG: hypothetical protein Fur0037_22400 [Planctomycetota bacterium]